MRGDDPAAAVYLQPASSEGDGPGRGHEAGGAGPVEGDDRHLIGRERHRAGAIIMHVLDEGAQVSYTTLS